MMGAALALLAQNLDLVILAVLIMVLTGLIIWRVQAPPARGRRRLPFKSEFTLVFIIALILMVAIFIIAGQQHNMVAVAEIAMAVLVYVFLRERISVAARHPRHCRLDAAPPDTITVDGKRLHLYKIFQDKVEAAEIVLSMKKQHGNKHMFRSRPCKIGTDGVVWAVYSDLCPEMSLPELPSPVN